MIELTRNQKIGVGLGAAGVLLVIAIVLIYFVFIKKDTPKPTSTSTPKSTTPTSTPTSTPKSTTPTSTQTSTPTSTPTSTQISNDIKTLVIKGYRLKDEKFLDYQRIYNNAPTEYESFKNKLTTDNGGCWSFNSAYPEFLGTDDCYITEVTLPSDIKAISSGTPLVLGGPNVCGFTEMSTVEPGKTTTFTGKTVYRLKFVKV